MSDLSAPGRLPRAGGVRKRSLVVRLRDLFGHNPRDGIIPVCCRRAASGVPPRDLLPDLAMCLLHPTRENLSGKIGDPLYNPDMGTACEVAVAGPLPDFFLYFAGTTVETGRTRSCRRRSAGAGPASSDRRLWSWQSSW